MTLCSKNRLLLLCVCLLVSFAGTAQWGNKVYQYNDSLNAIIQTYRTNVFNQLKNGQENEVVFNYGYETHLKSVYDASIQGSEVESFEHYLDLDEIEGIYLLQYNFTGILDIIRNNGFVFADGMRKEYVDPREATKAGDMPRTYNFGHDSLAIQIGDLVLNETPAIKGGITASNYSQEEQDFLNLFVDYEVVYLWDVWRWNFPSHEAEQLRIQEHLRLDTMANKQATEFIHQYPNSEFNDFINEFILRKFEVKNWIVGIDMLYLGTLIPTGELGDFMKVPYLYANLGFRVYYKNAYLNVMGGISSAGLKQDIYHDTLWTRGINMLTGDLTLGYCFDVTDRFVISPRFGVRGIINTGPKNEGEITRFDSKIPWTVGMEFAFGGLSDQYDHICPNYFRGLWREGIGLKVMYQNPGYEQILPELSGGLWTVTLGVNMARFGVKD